MSTANEHLKFALEAISSQKKELLAQLKELDRQESGIHSILNFGSGTNGSGLNQLMEFVLQMMNEHGSVNSKLLCKLADEKGVPYNDGRTFNTVLMSLSRYGKAIRVEKGDWRLAE